MRITAKVDYAMRACLALAQAEAGHPTPSAVVAEDKAIPARFLSAILADLRRGGLVRAQRGTEGGYLLARPPEQITMADIIRAVEGPLADVQGLRPDQLDWPAELDTLKRAWVATRGALRSVLEHVTLADLRDGRLDPTVDAWAQPEDAWIPR